MSKTTTFESTSVHGSGDGAKTVLSSKSFFSRMIEALQVNQQTRADRIVRPFLARASVSDLSALGFTASEITAIKRDRHTPVVSWY
ncbi:MAG: hypothetical protein ACK4MF_09450 [Hyphomicrobiaceae bacterium]